VISAGLVRTRRRRAKKTVTLLRHDGGTAGGPGSTTRCFVHFPYDSGQPIAIRWSPDVFLSHELAAARLAAARLYCRRSSVRKLVLATFNERGTPEQGAGGSAGPASAGHLRRGKPMPIT